MLNLSDYLHISLLTPLSDLGAWLCDDVGCTAEGSVQVTTVSDRKVAFSIASTEDQAREVSGTSIPVVLLRFVDVLSLQNTMELIEAHSSLSPALVLIYRNENESDFKMSCPYCGQKLWVRDADQDKSGRCPHCQKGFPLPAQEEHVTSSLSLSSSVPVHRIVRGEPGSLSLPLQLMVESEGAQAGLESLGEENISNATMKVELED